MTNKDWNFCCISDGDVEIFRDNTSPMATDGVLRTLCRHLDAIKAMAQAYADIKINVEKACVMINGNIYYDGKPLDISDDELFAFLLDE